MSARYIPTGNEYVSLPDLDEKSAALGSFSEKELDDTFRGDKTIEVCCQFCDKKYVINTEFFVDVTRKYKSLSWYIFR